MLTNHSPSPTAQWFREYWRQTRRPLASLAFILPLLVLYEGGVVLLGSQAVRNGADVTFTIYWKGPITSDGYTKVAAHYDAQVQRWTRTTILATNGITNGQANEAAFNIGFNIGRAMFED